MLTHDIIVIGASAGGVEVMKDLVRGLPADLPAAVFVVIHTAPTADSRLPWILCRRGPLPATEARDGEAIRLGHISVAAPDHHLTLQDGIIRVVHGPKENRSRPAIDPLFRSAAHAYGPRVAGVILSGLLNDGTAGLLAVQRGGGVTIVQDPEDALYPDMPRSALRRVPVDRVLPAAEIGPVLAGLARDPVPAGGVATMQDPTERADEAARRDLVAQARGQRRGAISPFACPDCGGVLWQVEEPGLAQFRCLAGHAYTGEGLLTEQGEALERSLWAVARGLGERMVLARQLGDLALAEADPQAAARYDEVAGAAQRPLRLIRGLILRDQRGGDRRRKDLDAGEAESGGDR
jgi:two-component system chemotaxis response regulator CheB